MTGVQSLTKILNLLSGGVTFLGAAVSIFGQLAGAIAMIAGGAIVAAAGVWFGSLDTSWMG